MDVGTARDIAIIFLALVNIVALVVVIVLALYTIKLVKSVQGEVSPLFSSARKTMDTVQVTTTLVGRTAVSPIVRVASAVAAASRFAQVMLGLDKDRRR
ncbi:MAG: hypothetical protein HY675_04820 [Chloroflexi bacterium]|nr:hypothetical protein [Chloroflexota bacterium]